MFRMWRLVVGRFHLSIVINTDAARDRADLVSGFFRAPGDFGDRFTTLRVGPLFVNCDELVAL